MTELHCLKVNSCLGEVMVYTVAVSGLLAGCDGGRGVG